MTSSDDQVFRDTLRAFRKKRVEPEWERLDAPNEVRYAALFSELHELGVTLLALPAERGGLPLDAAGLLAVARELGASVPALGFGLVSHAAALALWLEASDGAEPALVDAVLAGKRLALAGNPLDAVPVSGFDLRANGSITLSGKQRLALAYPEWLVVPANRGDKLVLCLIDAKQPGVHFQASTSSHGLCLVPVGELVLDQVNVSAERVSSWPSSGHAAQSSDGLVTALLLGMIDELAERAFGYALERYQGGKMIHEHDAVRQLVGPMELARRVLEPLAQSTLAARCAGDGGAAAFAVELARQSGLDAIQTFGGWGYMEDYRVERYLRDANTLDTTWIHAGRRKRQIAQRRFDGLLLRNQP
ncbi:MAG: Isovaleryl-CoA dehydrogenase [Myxococcaceae bacterium]|nr:Isovaleryl-CoA dehydrogenase [Myxococcaceae bacterium]